MYLKSSKFQLLCQEINVTKFTLLSNDQREYTHSYIKIHALVIKYNNIFVKTL